MKVLLLIIFVLSVVVFIRFAFDNDVAGTIGRPFKK